MNRKKKAIREIFFYILAVAGAFAFIAVGAFIQRWIMKGC